ncbi:MAG: hypothetical protein IJD79_00225 [Clostridia bacterium]|nr:hypothetical protein [Clostridia bacterium]
MKILYKLLASVLLVSVFIGSLTGCDALDSFVSSSGNVADNGDNVASPDDNYSDTDSGGQTPDKDEGEGTVPDEDGSNGSSGDDGADSDPDGDSKGENDPERDYSTDPYENMSAEEFYRDYEPAECYLDAYYRSLHYFMSGSIEAQDQYQTVAENRPMQDGKYVRNTAALYTEDGKGYHIVDENGDIVNTVYRGGGYVTLEEVAAYVFAFGDIPANYSSSKKAKPYESPWGVYLRVNHTKFSGNTSKYPYEPVLPRISGCGGDLQYYELDIGTTGTTCDPSYSAKVYNDGREITRGAARIVYTRFYYSSGFSVTDTNEKYVFYTNNHYNDFSEYLNYEGGWGEIFGNITGGGTISSKYDYNPTPYVKVARADFTADASVLFVAFIEIGKYSCI